MAIIFDCTCGQKLSAQEEHAGKQIQCPACKSVQVVPRQSGSETRLAEGEPRRRRSRRDEEDDDDISVRSRELALVEPINKAFYLGSIIGGLTLGFVIILIAAFPVIQQMQDFGRMGQGRPPEISPLIFLGYVPMIYAGVIVMILIYKMWSAIQDGRARTTPGMAVGLMFVPCFNIYWMFQVYWGWAVDYNKYIDRHRLDVPRVNETIPLTSCILAICSAIPCIGIVLALVNIVLTFMFFSNACDGVNALADASSSAE